VPLPAGFWCDSESASFTFADGVTVAVASTDRTNRDGKPYWLWVVSDAKRFSDGDDLAGWGDARAMLESLLSFLSAAADACSYTMRTGRESDNSGMFPAWVSEWAYGCADELALASLELSEGGAS